MARTQRKNLAISKAISERFIHAYEVGMGISMAELSRRLGYANSTTIQAIKRGETLPDIARIAEHIDDLKNRRGDGLNLHWLITGVGKPFVLDARKINFDREVFQDEYDIIMLIREMTTHQKSAFKQFIMSMR